MSGNQPEISKDDQLHGRTSYERGAAVLKSHLKTMPAKPGVYRMLSDNGSVLYVGKAKNLIKRVASYTQRGRLPNRLQRMVAQTKSLEIVVTNTEAEALLLEANLIRRFLPPFNILLRDDKSYPYILIRRDHPYPQIVKHRGAKTEQGWYFGPFASAAAVNETLTLLQRGFMLRNCSDTVFANRTRPCLQFHIKRCTAPCVHKVTDLEYAKQVEEARAFLRGKNQEIQQDLAKEMQSASDLLDYEKAAVLRDRIRVLTSIQTRQDINVAGINDADVFALAQKGGKTAIQVFFFRADRNYGTRCYFPSHDKQENPEEIIGSFLAQFYADKPCPPQILLSHKASEISLLEEALSKKMGHAVELLVPKRGDRFRIVEHARSNALTSLVSKLSERAEQTSLLDRVAEIFKLGERPERIEVYDNSHISGSHAVAAMVVAGGDGFIKKAYRKFTIKNPSARGDDYAMMDEVFQRRFRRTPETNEIANPPDLILIDGGQGQLSRVKQVLNDLGLSSLPCVAIAKGPDRNAGKERFFQEGREPLSLPMDDPVLYYLQRLRDEAHRFAIGTHRAKRIKAIGQSGLDEVPGIGSVRKKALLQHFGSGKAVAEASLDDLRRVPGVSRNIAKKIHDYFHEPA